jgi:membrane dipeptidase
VHVTVGDFLADFATVCEQILAWQLRIREQADRLFQLRDAGDVDRIGADGRVGVVFGLQNSALLDGRLERLEYLHGLGVRVLQLTYNEGNLVADGCLEPRDAGLTRFGRAVVAECNRLGIVIDLSHVGRRATLETAELSAAPVVCSHANRAALAGSPRNKSDEEIMAVARSGGIIGASPYGPICWSGNGRPTASTFVEQVRSLVSLVGEEAVAIGTDHAALSDDAALRSVLGRSLERYPEIFADYAQAFGNEIEARYCEGLDRIEMWPRIPALLAQAGFSDATVGRLVGGNWIDFYRRAWSASA